MSRYLLPQGVSRLDLGERISGWAAEFGKTIDVRFMGSSHVGFTSFDYRYQTLLTGITDFYIRTTLPQGMRRDHTEQFNFPTQTIRRLFCLQILKIMRRVKCLETASSRCSVPGSSTQMVCPKIPPLPTMSDTFLRGDVEVSQWSQR